MRLESTISDDEKTNEPDWVLASYGQRVGAWALDFVLSIIPKAVLFVLALSFILKVALSGVGSVFDIPDWSTRTGAIVAVLIGVTIGYIVWWLFALGRGQTPGKQIVGISRNQGQRRAIRMGLYLPARVCRQIPAPGIPCPSHLWHCLARGLPVAVWDRAEKMQTLHDKLLGTIVVRNR